jgi:hypothetical protein
MGSMHRKEICLLSKSPPLLWIGGWELRFSQERSIAQLLTSPLVSEGTSPGTLVAFRARNEIAVTRNLRGLETKTPHGPKVTMGSMHRKEICLLSKSPPLLWIGGWELRFSQERSIAQLLTSPLGLRGDFARHPRCLRGSK